MYKHKLDINKIRLIGFHGQTIYHKSLLLHNKDDDADEITKKMKSDAEHIEKSMDIIKGKSCETWQIGNAKLLFDKLKIPIVYNLRYNDILNGGQGAL